MAVTKRTDAQWKELIAECEASGQTQKEWCLSRGINLYTYRDRTSRLRRSGRQRLTDALPLTLEKQSTMSDWIEIKAKAGQSGIELHRTNAPLVIETGVLRITTDATFPMSVLAALIREMASPC